MSEGAVIDGDTCHLLTDKGEKEYGNKSGRLWGIDAPELNDPDPAVRERAKAARDWLKARIEGKQVFILSKGFDKYANRMDVVIWENEADFEDWGKSVNSMLLELGLAVPYTV